MIRNHSLIQVTSMAGIAAQIEINQVEQDILNKILRSRILGSSLQDRDQIILAASEKQTNLQIQAQFGLEEHRVALWRNRWKQQHDPWKQSDEKLRPPMSEKLVRQWLADKKGRGRKATITQEQKVLILAVACEPPEKSGYPHTHWTARLLAKEVIRRGIVATIAFQTVWNFLKGK